MGVSERWVVVLLVCAPTWTVNFLAIFSISFLQHSLLKTMNWSNADYSAVVSTSFAGAMTGPLLVLWLQRRVASVTHLAVLFSAQCVNLFSMAAFSVAVFYKTPLWCVALSRFGVGVCMGVTDAWMLHTIAMLFPTDAAAPFGVLVTGYDLAMFLGRIMYPKVMHAFGSVAAPFALCTATCLIPIICIAFCHVFYERATALVNRSVAQTYATVCSDEEKEEEVVAKLSEEELSTVTRMRRLPVAVKCAIMFTALYGTIVNLVGSLMTEPLVDTYHMSESQADNWWALASLACVALCALSGWVMDTWRLHFELGAVAATMWLTAFTLLAFGTRQLHAAIAVVLFSVGYPISNVAMTISALIVPRRHLQLTAALQSTIWWLLSICSTEMFGYVADATDGFRVPLLYTAVFLAMPHFIILCYLWNHHVNKMTTDLETRNGRQQSTIYGSDATSAKQRLSNGISSEESASFVER